MLTHGDSLTVLAPEFKAIAYSGSTVVGMLKIDVWLSLIYYLMSVLAIANESTRVYGVQFHPEVDLTPSGRVMMKNFLRHIVGLHGTFTMQCREQECIDHIRNAVGDRKVLVRRFLFVFYWPFKLIVACIVKDAC